MPLVSADHVSGRENVSLAAAKKATNTVIEKRTALGDLGNKIGKAPSQAGKIIKDGAKKVMGPPVVLPKKPITTKTAVPVTKTNIKKANTTSNSIIISKDTNIKQKPVIKKPTLVRNPSQTSISSITSDTITSFSTKQLWNVTDPDEATKNEPQHVNDYIPAIFNYLRELETRYEIRDGFLTDHKTSVRMRSVLINWIVDVHKTFKLYLETLHMCVGLIDRYLQDNKNVGKDNLQLVGTTALLIACKYEEIFTPDLTDFVFMCDDAFTRQQILQMERKMLTALEFNLGRPLSIHFLRRYSKVAQVDVDKHVLGKYLLELALLEYDLAHVKPSIQAAAACCLAIAIIDEVLNPRTVWTSTMVYYSTYEYSEINAVINILAGLIINAKHSKYDAVYIKYSSAKHSRTSLNPKLYSQMVKRLAESAKKTAR